MKDLWRKIDPGVLEPTRDWYGNRICWQDRWNNSRTVPGLESSMEPMHPVCFRTSDGQTYLIDWRDIEIAMERDPEGRTIPSGNPNELLLTADDSALLWEMGIGF